MEQGDSVGRDSAEQQQQQQQVARARSAAVGSKR